MKEPPHNPTIAEIMTKFGQHKIPNRGFFLKAKLSEPYMKGKAKVVHIRISDPGPDKRRELGNYPVQVTHAGEDPLDNKIYGTIFGGLGRKFGIVLEAPDGNFKEYNLLAKARGRHQTK